MCTHLTIHLQTQTWLRWLVILGVFTLSAGFAYLGGRAGTLALLAVPAILGVLAVLRWPPLGLLSIVPVALVIPLEIGTGTQTTLNAAVLYSAGLIGLWLFDRFTIRRELILLRSRVFIPLLGLVSVASLAFFVGQLPWYVYTRDATLMAQLGGLAVFVLSAGAFVLTARQITEIQWLERLTWLFLTFGGLYIVGRIVPGLGRLLDLFPNGATGSAFWIWIVALSISQALFNTRMENRWRFALGMLTLFAFYIGLFRVRWWASGWLPSLVALFVIIWVSAPRLGLMATLVIGVVGVFNAQLFIGLIMVGDQQYSMITRWEAWSIIVEIPKVNPLLGLGPANYYWYTTSIPILGWYVSFNSHNQYIDLFAQTGILGLAFYLWFVCEAWRLGWRLREQVPQGGFAQAYVIGALGGLAGMMVAGMLGDWVLPFVYNIGLTGFRSSVLGWLFLGGLVAIEQMIEKKKWEA